MEVREYIYENKLYCYDFIEKNIPGAKVVRAEATYLIWVDVSGYTEDSADLKEKIFERTGLYLSSGAAYGEPGRQFLRINLATQRANVIDGMNRLKKALLG
jgi:cystathionine beta-lyase